MKPEPSQLDRFVSALHRRLLFVRAGEATGLGALAGCAVGLVLIPLLLWRGADAMTPALGTIGLGALTGLAWGLTRRPTGLQAAAEADRQLQLADLLGTALTVRKRSRESDLDLEAGPWLQSVLAVAEETCRRHTPSEVILHRLNARAWAGIAVAAALVTSLAALTAQQPTARAAASRARHPAYAGNDPSRQPERPHEIDVTRPGGESARSQGTGPDSGEPRGAGSLPDSPAATSPSENPGKATATGDTGAGGAAGRARTPRADETRIPLTPSSAPSNGKQPAGGTGAAATQASGEGVASQGAVAGESGNATPAPPWQTPAWSDDARRAHEAIDSGRVPDARRDLVREYFERS
jgi:hypothetical protein